MKVAMVVPMSPESAVGDVMVRAIPSLTDRWDIEVWCPAEATYRPCPVRVTPFGQSDGEVLDALATFDLVVYVFGNSPRHSLILPLAQALPGLVVLHDVALTSLVRHVAVVQNGIDALAKRVETTYGADAARIIRNPEKAGGDNEWLRYCASVPLSEIATEGSLGVVVHSWWHGRMIDGTLLGDVTVAPLPVPSTELGFEHNDRAATSALLDELEDQDLLLVSVGAINANRRIDLLLEAIARDPDLANRLQLWAVGPVEDQAAADLLRLARSLGVQDRFTITGRVSDGLLEDILARADIAAALRDPVLEGQSASVLTQLLFALPTIVFDHAHYSELPDEVAIKVDPGNAVVGLENAIRALVDDDEGRIRRGDLAREYVLQSRTGAAYAAALLEAGERALATRPYTNLSADLRSRLRRLDLHHDDGVVKVVSDLSFELFDLA